KPRLDLDEQLLCILELSEASDWRYGKHYVPSARTAEYLLYRFYKKRMFFQGLFHYEIFRVQFHTNHPKCFHLCRHLLHDLHFEELRSNFPIKSLLEISTFFLISPSIYY